MPTTLPISVWQRALLEHLLKTVLQLVFHAANLASMLIQLIGYVPHNALGCTTILLTTMRVCVWLPVLKAPMRKQSISLVLQLVTKQPTAIDSTSITVVCSNVHLATTHLWITDFVSLTVVTASLETSSTIFVINAWQTVRHVWLWTTVRLAWLDCTYHLESVSLTVCLMKMCRITKTIRLWSVLMPVDAQVALMGWIAQKHAQQRVLLNFMLMTQPKDARIVLSLAASVSTQHIAQRVSQMQPWESITCVMPTAIQQTHTPSMELATRLAPMERTLDQTW